MEPRKRTWETNMKTDYGLMKMQLESLSQGVEWDITILSNASALLWDSLEDINWAGFYIMRGGHLELGPFQGKPACVRIEAGKGVCGTAVAENRTQLVADVHAFPGHIACDAASRSEIVLPIRSDGRIVGVLDIDSPEAERFSIEDEKGLALLSDLIGAKADFAGQRW
jgi:GAF domain-containing protein